MVRKIKSNITASTFDFDSKTVSPSEVVILLSAISQLQGCDIAVSESAQNNLQFIVDDDVYELMPLLSMMKKHPRHLIKNDGDLRYRGEGVGK